MEYPIGACTIPDAVSIPDSDVHIGMAICLGDEVLDSLNCWPALVGIPALSRLPSDLSPLKSLVEMPSFLYDGEEGLQYQPDTSILMDTDSTGDYGYIRLLDRVVTSEYF